MISNRPSFSPPVPRSSNLFFRPSVDFNIKAPQHMIQWAVVIVPAVWPDILFPVWVFITSDFHTRTAKRARFQFFHHSASIKYIVGFTFLNPSFSYT
jgi:hypothetical protein